MKKEKNLDRQEVEYKQKAGTAWSHSYLNQKPWHPLSYPNQRRKWIAEQTHAQREQQVADVAREFAQEQEFFRQTAQMTKKEKEKMEQLQAVSFMYIRPPGYNAEAARAAEIADERKRLGLTTTSSSAPDETSNAGASQGNTSTSGKEVGKARVKDVFGRTLPTAEEFPALKNAPRLETGAPVRLKPFAIEIRNVMCARCGAFGHQSGDRECSLKDTLMPNEEARLKREDPLNVILAQTASDEPLKWELKQPPGGLSPARGGFRPDDPNQQIIPDEDIYDEHGGFLAGGGEDEGLSIPNVLASLSRKQRRELTDANIDVGKRSKTKKKKKKHKLSKKENGSDEEQLRQRHRDKTRSAKHEGDRKAEVSPSGSDEDQIKHSSDDDQKKRHREKGRRAKRKGRREESSSASDDEEKIHRSDGEQRRKKRRDKKKSARSERKRQRISDSSGDDQRRHGTDEDQRARKHRKKKKPTRSDSEGKREVSSDTSDDGLRSYSSCDDEQRTKRHLQKRKSGKRDGRRTREVSCDEDHDDEEEAEDQRRQTRDSNRRKQRQRERRKRAWE